LGEILASVQAEQRYMRMRERVHRDSTFLFALPSFV